MTYVALLRGINVGGNNKIDMKQLKKSFARVGMNHVQTYINSGNIIFTNEGDTVTEITRTLEDVIEQDFALRIRVLLRNLPEMEIVMNALPPDWQNNADMKSDVLFLWEEIDKGEIPQQINPRAGVDTVCYVPGALLWSLDRKHSGKSSLMKIASSTLYKQMTIRNVNSVRKIHALMQKTESGSIGGSAL